MNISLDSIKKLITAFLHRFHIVIFVIITIGGLALVIFLLNNTIVMSSQSNGYTPSANDSSFDQTTIKKVEDLKTANQATGPIDLSNGRSNPFVE